VGPTLTNGKLRVLSVSAALTLFTPVVATSRGQVTRILLNVLSNLAMARRTHQLTCYFQMATTAQILANRQNAERSVGPVTAEGRARVSQNATKFGLFSVANFVRPEEQHIFNEFDAGYLA